MSSNVEYKLKTRPTRSLCVGCEGQGSKKSLQSLRLSNAKMPIPAEIGKTRKGTSWMQEKGNMQILHLVGNSVIIPWTSH